MFLPISTDANDSRVRMGVLGIVVACLFVHMLVSQDSSRIRGERAEGVRAALDSLTHLRIDSEARAGAEYSMLQVDSLIAVSRGELQELRSQSLLYRLALVPADFNILNLITSLFTHAGWWHLIGNMWFFYLVGVTMEKYWGMGRFIGLYLVCGLAGNLAYLLVQAMTPGLAEVPLVGASGAIAGMMGAFLVTHGGAKVRVLWYLYIRAGVFTVPASLFLGFWLFEQLLYGYLTRDVIGGTAYSAHIVGFLTGVVLGKTTSRDGFYERAYARSPSMGEWLQADTESPVAEQTSLLPEKSEVPEQSEKAENAVKAEPASPNSDSSPESPAQNVQRLIEQGEKLIDLESPTQARDFFMRAMDKMWSTPQMSVEEMGEALDRVLQSGIRLALPPVAYYHWARQAEERGLWQKAIGFYDAAAADPAVGHAQLQGLARAAALRQSHGVEPELVKQGWELLLSRDPHGPLAEEARMRLMRLELT